MKKQVKRAMTLLEIMIVIFIIGIIGSVIGYNMRGSLDEGKAFKTKEAARKLYEIIELEIAKGAKPTTDSKEIEALLKQSGLVRKPADLLCDGWQNAFSFYMDGESHVRFNSTKYEEYCEKKGKPRDYPWEEDADTF